MTLLELTYFFKTRVATLVTVLALFLNIASIGCNSSKPSAEIVCGGPMNFACPADMYCNMKEDCGGIDGNGICIMRPTQCKSEINPVCGCDGQTYSNPCLAAAKGVSQKNVGECKVVPTMTSGPIDGEQDNLIPEEMELEEGISGE